MFSSIKGLDDLLSLGMAGNVFQCWESGDALYCELSRLALSCPSLTSIEAFDWPQSFECKDHGKDFKPKDRQTQYERNKAAMNDSLTKSVLGSCIRSIHPEKVVIDVCQIPYQQLYLSTLSQNECNFREELHLALDQQCAVSATKTFGRSRTDESLYRTQ